MKGSVSMRPVRLGLARSPIFVIVAAALAVAATGCRMQRQDAPPAYQTLAADPRRDSAQAEAENRRGKALLGEGQPAQAEEALKTALAADLFHGPAHNNLGAAYLAQKKLYLAAWEFQYAARLMPGRPEPRNNLGMVFEAVGRTDEAAAEYRKALEVSPEDPEIIGNLARCRVRAGHKDDRTRELLEQLVLKDPRPEWVDWARGELGKLPPPAAPAERQPPMVPTE